ncbi:Aste57867_11687 [Aphanomyces stellatus]|uniref:Aste57867_11687 protein n=1 Tax=Aphanomyces stellatus TaxID=120398 RepID=A0A485KTN2_9STRA|nr:hypothetical protein As57867_011644 [Aphanomyces stellatus]VFT88544.1 Aste57867_11687 [Aphanomyces stellatus]
MRGCCSFMCPKREANERTKYNELSKFELPPHVPVKRYRRSAAGTVIDPADVRPPSVLRETTHYLLSLLPSEMHMSIDLYHFLDDRFRAIRTDLVLQDEAADDILQPIARFYLVVQCILLHETTGRRDVTYASLRQLLEDQLHSVLLLLKQSSPEFQRYYLLMHVDGPGFALKLRDNFLHTTDKLTWKEAVWPWFRAASHKVVMEPHLIHRAILFSRLPVHMEHHLRRLAKAYTKQDQFPVADVARFLGLPSIHDATLLCRAFHLDVHDADSPFVRFNERPIPDVPDADLLAAFMHEEFSRIDGLREGTSLQDILLHGVDFPSDGEDESVLG